MRSSEDDTPTAEGVRLPLPWNVNYVETAQRSKRRIK